MEYKVTCIFMVMKIRHSFDTRAMMCVKGRPIYLWRILILYKYFRWNYLTFFVPRVWHFGFVPKNMAQFQYAMS